RHHQDGPRPRHRSAERAPGRGVPVDFERVHRVAMTDEGGGHRHAASLSAAQAGYTTPDWPLYGCRVPSRWCPVFGASSQTTYGVPDLRPVTVADTVQLVPAATAVHLTAGWLPATSGWGT